MAFDRGDLRRIFDRTDGRCHLCGKRLCFNNYGRFGRRAAWEVEHSVARASGGSDHLNNLFAACITCNREKGTLTTRTARGHNGRSAAPLSVDRKRKIRNGNTAAGVSIGVLVGGFVGGPPGAVLGALVGGGIGHSIDPDE